MTFLCPPDCRAFLSLTSSFCWRASSSFLSLFSSSRISAFFRRICTAFSLARSSCALLLRYTSSIMTRVRATGHEMLRSHVNLIFCSTSLLCLIFTNFLIVLTAGSLVRTPFPHFEGCSNHHGRVSTMVFEPSMMDRGRNAKRSIGSSRNACLVRIDFHTATTREESTLLHAVMH